MILVMGNIGVGFIDKNKYYSIIEFLKEIGINYKKLSIDYISFQRNLGVILENYEDNLESLILVKKDKVEAILDEVVGWKKFGDYYLFLSRDGLYKLSSNGKLIKILDLRINYKLFEVISGMDYKNGTLYVSTFEGQVLRLKGKRFKTVMKFYGVINQFYITKYGMVLTIDYGGPINLYQVRGRKIEKLFSDVGFYFLYTGHIVFAKNYRKKAPKIIIYSLKDRKILKKIFQPFGNRGVYVVDAVRNIPNWVKLVEVAPIVPIREKSREKL